MERAITYDAIVIGSGPAGLTAAAALARQEKRVLLLEQHFALGGNAQTFRRKRMFDFDVGIHCLDDCGPEGIVPSILKNLGISELEFAPLDPDGFDVLMFPDCEFRVPNGWNAYRAQLHRAFPPLCNVLDDYVDYMQSLVARVGMGGSFHKLVLLRRPSQLLKPLLQGDPSYLAKTVERTRTPRTDELDRRIGKSVVEATLGDVFNAFRFTDEVKHVLGGQNLLYGECWTRASAAMHAIVLDRYLRGAYFPQGGAKALINALARTIESHGGEIRRRTRVTRIVIEEEHIVGVELEGGEQIKSHVVVSNADSTHTLRFLVGNHAIPKELKTKIESAEMAVPLFVMYLALKCDPDALGLTNANYWLFPRYKLEEQYAACYAGTLPHDPMVYLSIASLKDRHNQDVAPSGYTNLQLMTLAPSAPEAWGVEGTPLAGFRYRHNTQYVEAKREFERRMVATVETMMPGLLREIAWQESATPLTQERFALSSGGTGYGLAHIPRQFLTGRYPIVSGINGLYLVGANTLFGHGATGAMLSGRACAQVVSAYLET